MPSIHGKLSYADGQPVVRAECFVYPQTAPQVPAWFPVTDPVTVGPLVVSRPARFFTDTAGGFTVSVVSGQLVFQFPGADAFTVDAPNSSGTVDIGTVIV